MFNKRNTEIRVPKTQIEVQTNLHYRCYTNQINKLVQYFLMILVARESQG